jgi:hypothetical protein
VAAFALVSAAGPVQAQEPLLGAHLSTTINFPNFLTFNLNAQAPVVIERAEVVYHVEALTCGTATAIGIADLTPASDLDVSWEWDLRDAGGIPVGARVTYHWLLTGAGRTFETDEQTLTFEDPRFEWRIITGEHTRLKWYAGDDDFARDLLSVADAGIRQLQTTTGVLPANLVEVRIYETAEAMRETVLFSPEWAGGIAFPNHGLVAMGINRFNISWGRDAMVHEMTHVVMGQSTFRCGSSLPAWFDEGLAVFNESSVAPAFTSALNNAIENDAAFTVRGIAGAFPSTEDGAILAYAQSQSVVSFLMNQFGSAKMNQMLTAFGELGTIDRALQAAYGFDTDGLDAAWRSFVGLPARSGPATIEPELIPTIPPLGLPGQPTPTPSEGTTPTPSPSLSVTPTPTFVPTLEPTPTPSPSSPGGSGCNRSDTTSGLDGGLLIGLALAGTVLARRLV